jgi:penicillin V acylase-like amidase (Ntn superfamily)
MAECLGPDYPGTEGKICIYDTNNRMVLTNSEQYETHTARIDAKLEQYTKLCDGNWQCIFTAPGGMPADYFSPARYEASLHARIGLNDTENAMRQVLLGSNERTILKRWRKSIV